MQRHVLPKGPANRATGADPSVPTGEGDRHEMETPQALPECLQDFQRAALKAGTPVFRYGDPCQHFYFVEAGSIRVDLISPSGKSVLLYRIGVGETCVLTTSCLFSNETYAAEAITESDVAAVIVPKAAFEDRLNTSPAFRTLVFASFATRLSHMMARIEEVAFSSLGQRMARRVLELSGKADKITITHEQLAGDLGSAREAIGRKLVDWERRGLIQRGRGTLRIRAAKALSIIAVEGD